MDDLLDFRSDLSEAFHDRLLCPRTSGPWSPAAQAVADGRLAADALAMIESGTMVATLHTRVLRRVFGIEPVHALGYSVGEAIMLVALGVWSDGDVAQRRLVESPLFTTELVGPKRAVRRLWGLGPDATLDWGGRVLLASRERVEAQLRPDERAYVTIANAPEETVVTGDAAACARLAERVGCESVLSPFDHVLHCPATMLEVDEFARHMRNPHQPAPGIAFHSGGSTELLGSDVERTAATLAHMSCRQLDFVGLVDRVYASGARVFVEVGPGATTTRLIQATLRGRPHLAVAVSRRGQDDQSAWPGALAILVTHRVPVDLGALARA